MKEKYNALKKKTFLDSKKREKKTRKICFFKKKMAKFFHVRVFLRENDNYVHLIRDHCPEYITLKRHCSDRNDKINKTVQDFFQNKVKHFTAVKIKEEYDNDEEGLYYVYEKQLFFLREVSFALKSKKKKKQEDKNPFFDKEESTVYKQELILKRLKKNFERSFVVPLPHQRTFLEQLWLRIGGASFFKDVTKKAFFLLFWTMGSGKSIGALQLFSTIYVPVVYIVCQNTMIRQWVKFIESMPQPDNTKTHFHIIGLTEFGRMASENQLIFKDQYVIFDEAHLFRNRTESMTEQIQALQQAKLLFNLTGTPIINSIQELVSLAMIHGVTLTKDDMKLFEKLARNESQKTSLTKNYSEELQKFLERYFTNKVFFYDPKLSDINHVKDYPPFKIVCKEVTLTLKQTVDYMVQKRQNFEIGDLCITHGRRNAYRTTEKAICNSSLCSESPKFVEIAKNVVEFKDGFPQVVFSHFIYNGISPLKSEILKQFSSSKASQSTEMILQCATGESPAMERNLIFEDFNNRKVDVLLMCKIGETGVNLLGTKALHLADSCENLQQEMQIFSRILRYNSHNRAEFRDEQGNIKPVIIFKYLSCFPKKEDLRKQKKLLENYFYTQYCNTKLGSQQDYFASFDFCELFIEKIHQEEHWQTVDQKLEISNSIKQESILPSIQALQRLGSHFDYA